MLGRMEEPEGERKHGGCRFAASTRAAERAAPSPRTIPPVTDLAVPPRFLEDVYQAASECNKCSLCQAVCPTYVTNPVEWETARGRVSLVRDAIEGRIELRDIADGPLSTCLTCDNCVAACAPRVPTAWIVSRARMELHEQEGHPWGQSMAFRSVLPRPGVLRFLHGLSRAAQVTGLHAFARKTGLTRWLGTGGALMEHVGPLPRKTAYQRSRAPARRDRAGARHGLASWCAATRTWPCRRPPRRPCACSSPTASRWWSPSWRAAGCPPSRSAIARR